MAGITLRVKHVRVLFESANLGEAIGGNADLAAPLVVDVHIGQLREHLEHFRAHIGGDVRRIAPGIMTSAAKQQPSISRESVIVQPDFLIAQRQVLWNQLRGAAFVQRLGGNDVTAGGQHFAAEFGFQFIQMRVAAEHQAAGAH